MILTETLWVAEAYVVEVVYIVTVKVIELAINVSSCAWCCKHRVAGSKLANLNTIGDRNTGNGFEI
jgi:hypothetical protein